MAERLIVNGRYASSSAPDSCFNPLEQNSAPFVFVQLPIPGDEKGWIRLGDEDARRLRMLMESASRSASHDDTDAD